MDVWFDDKGDLDRQSFLVEVKNGRQQVVATLPPLNAKP
jgi:branched-chain amino acid transport system substrate-binding protein